MVQAGCSVQNKARVFVGSSTEGLAHAREVAAMLTDDFTDCLLWTEAFPAGYFTFESLENVLERCCGAVFVITPDDKGTVRGVEVHIPRANIVLEFGLLAGRLGRHNIALCQFGQAELPSDLRGLTLIRMDPVHHDPAFAQDARAHAVESIRVWSSLLVSTAERIARTDVVHGYSGRWRFSAQIEVWRNIPVKDPSYVWVNGILDIWIGETGLRGTGFGHGSLVFNLLDSGTPHRGAFTGELRVAHNVTALICRRDGDLEFTTEVFSLQPISVVGDPWPELSGIREKPEPWPFYWTFHCVNEPRTLEGTLTTRGIGQTQGKVRATKDS